LKRFALPIVVLAAFAGMAPGFHVLASAADRNTAPSFAVRTFDGKTTRLSELRGRPVVLDFWATWSRPCRVSMPDLSAMQERYRLRGLVVLGLSIDEAEPLEVRTFTEKLGVRFRIGMADERVLDDYGPIRSIPTTFFINRQGEIVRRVVGYIDEETLEGYVREIL
jgi:peroxiredoxin